MTGEWEHPYGDKSTYAYTEGEIIIHCNDSPEGKVTHAWLRGGQLAVPIPSVLTFNDILAMCKRAVEDEYYWCTTCSTTIDKDTEGGSHFAGHYCKRCWPVYQERNSRRCRLCGQPLWACYC